MAFYQYLGAHSLLIGLLPFYLPVWLWRDGTELPAICFFIAITGAGFAASLYLWEACVRQLRLPTVFLISFMLELVVVALASLSLWIDITILFVPLAIAVGVYNCFFWTTQRSLFLARVSSQDSGRQYGNLQIFVALFLKIGILAGGFLLEKNGMLAVLAVSAVVTLGSSVWFYRTNNVEIQGFRAKPASLADLKGFSDKLNSRQVFLVDGLFLFLESHFWTISLFLLARENFTRLGVVVVLLAVAFGLIFYVSKNFIDRIAGLRVFQISVVIYALGWLLRATLNEDTSFTLSTVILVTITFCTSFFRLFFNKRFFDVAGSSSGQHYLVVKSYYTQGAAMAIFTALGLMLLIGGDASFALPAVYLLAACVSLVYLGYRMPANTTTSPLKTS